jgi:hypothetical protein
MTITLTREEAQQVLNALEQLYGWDTATQGDIVFDPSDEIEILRARIAQPETSYETGQRLYREGKGISFIPTAVERDDQIGEALRGFEDARLAQPEPEPVSLKQIAAERGINMPETYVPTMDDAVAAADGVLMNEQASLLRECRAALDSLIQQKPSLAGLHCGSTTLGNLKASLYGYRPQGVFGNTAPPQREWQGLTDKEKKTIYEKADAENWHDQPLLEAVEAKLKEKNT